MTEGNIETEILQKTEALNLEIYVLFCKLDRYKDKLTEPTYRYMADKLYLMYREEFERMTADYLIEREQKKYEYKKRRMKLVPRESRLFHRRNRAAKYFFKKVCAEQAEYFSKLKAKLAAERAPAGVNERCQRSEPSNVANTGADLPITTLQACDELIYHIAAEEPAQIASPTPQNPPKAGARDDDALSDEKPNAPKTGKGDEGK